MRINLTDNNAWQTPGDTYDRDSIAALFPIAGRSISELCKENENLLIFPYSLKENGDDIGDGTIINLQNTQDPDRFVIQTGNIMGFFGKGDVQVKIQSRFDSGREDYFLHYMLQRVMRFNLVDLKHDNDQEEVLDFMMFMFPYFLKNALRQGVYREYQRFHRNDANIKGRVDVGVHIRQNIPFSGKIAYSTREFSYDNSLTELIRHTIEYMASTKYGKAVLNIDSETKENVSAIISITPSYDKSRRSIIISHNLRHATHPYYTEYSPLRSLCLQILRREEVKYGEQQDEVYGILFDGAWLWEEYVNTILRPYGFIHPENRIHKGRIYLFSDPDEKGVARYSGEQYPDFYTKDMVLDTKYKRFEKCKRVSDIDNNDIHQIITYMTALKVHKGGFVAPFTIRPDKVLTSHLKESPSSSISFYGVEISKSKAYAEFIQEMATNEAAFVQAMGN